MSNEVLTTSAAALTVAAALILQTTLPHQRASVFVSVPANKPLAVGSVWVLYGVNGVNKVPLASGMVTANDGVSHTIIGLPTENPNFSDCAAFVPGLLGGVEANGMTVQLWASSPFGAVNGITATLIGFDPATPLANGQGTGSVTLAGDNAEHNVATLAGGFSRVNVQIDPSVDVKAIGSIWRLYSQTGGVNTLLAQAGPLVGSPDVNGRPTLAPIAQDLFGDLVVGGDTLLLTVQSPLNTGSTPITAAIVGSSIGGSSAAGITMAGDDVGPSGANTVQSLTGGFGGNAGFVSLGGFIGVGAFATLAQTGTIRWGNLTATATILLASRNSANTGDYSIISTDQFNDLVFGNTNQSATYVRGNQVQFVNGNANTLAWSAATLATVGGSTFSVTGFVGAWTTTSDSNLTGYDWNLNGSASLLGVRANWNIGQTASGASVSFDGTNINLKVGAVNIAEVTATKFVTQKGIRRTVRSVGASTTLTTSDDIVVFSANAQTATLPASPTAGDKYSVGMNLGLVGNYVIAGNGINVVDSGASAASATISVATGRQISSVVYDGTVWVCGSGI